MSLSILNFSVSATSASGSGLATGGYAEFSDGRQYNWAVINGAILLFGYRASGRFILRSPARLALVASRLAALIPAEPAPPAVDPALALARPVLARLPALAAARDVAGGASALVSLRGLISLMPEPVLFAFADEMLAVLAADRAFVDAAWSWAAAQVAADVAAGAAARSASAG